MAKIYTLLRSPDPLLAAGSAPDILLTSLFPGSLSRVLILPDRAEQRLRMCIEGRGLGSNLVSFSKGFSKHPHFLAIIKVDSEYSRLPFKLKVDYFILY